MSDTEESTQLPDSENPHAAEFAVLDALQKENADLKDQRLRALAEMENVRRIAAREKAEKLGVKVDDIFAALQANLGSVYVNDYNQFGRTWQVRMQADAQSRADPTQLRRLEVKNRNGGKVPLGTLLTVEPKVGPRSDDYRVVTAYVAAGLGVALVPELALPAGDDLPSNLAVIELIDTHLTREVSLLTAPTLDPSLVDLMTRALTTAPAS